MDRSTRCPKERREWAVEHVFDLALARADGSYLKALEKIAKVELLVPDD